MKVYGSGTDATATMNGHGRPVTDSDDTDDFDDDEWAGEDGQYDYSDLFKAPNYADFIKTKPNSKAKTYEVRVASLMKAGMIMSLNNKQWPDAATFMKHGPGFAKAAGNLAAEDARAAALVEMLTAPESPYVMFALVAIPLVSQLFRNHQPQIEDAHLSWRERRAQRKAEKRAGFVKERPKPITVHLFRREFNLPLRFTIRLPRFRNMFKAFLAPTQHPQQIAQEVFQDPAVVKALHQMGLYPRERTDADQAA